MAPSENRRSNLSSNANTLAPGEEGRDWAGTFQDETAVAWGIVIDAFED